MGKERFVETGENSFFGDYIYDQIVPQAHFLRKLKQIIPWERFTKRLIDLYKGDGMYGYPPFEPALLLKMEMVAYLYNLSERQVTQQRWDAAVASGDRFIWSIVSKPVYVSPNNP